MNQLFNQPSVQLAFMAQFDGTLESALTFPELWKVLNPCFTAHYFYVSGDSAENMVTTYHTTGECASWGNQTKEQELNAMKFAKIVKLWLLSFKPVAADSLYSLDELKTMASKVSQVRKRACFTINGQVVMCKGLNVN